MARKPNYGQQRSAVRQGKLAKAAAREQERAEAVARRRAGLPDLAPSDEPDEPPPADRRTDEPA